MRNIILGAVVSVALTACFGNDSAPLATNGASTINTTEMAECNSINIPAFNFAGLIGTYYNTNTGGISPTYLILNVTSYPAALLTSSTVQIEFVPWYEMAVGSKTFSSTPLNFYFMDKITGQTAPNSPVQILNLAVINQAMSQFNFSSLGLTISDFFAREMIVLVGVNTEYEAATVAYYDTSVSTAAQFSGDVLLPAFYADPNAFAQAYPLADLYDLHPFNAYQGKNVDVDFGVLDDQICSQMSGDGGRVPSSVDDDIAEIKEKLKSIRYLVAGHDERSQPRGEAPTGIFERIWHNIVEALALYK